MGLLPGCGRSKRATSAPKHDPTVVRYRLPLRENPVDVRAARLCFNDCQPERSPDGYLSCLMECPGADRTPGVSCTDYEVPPYAACFTASKVKREELKPGWVVVGWIAGMAVVVSVASLCAANSAGCGTWGIPGWYGVAAPK